MNYIEKLLKKRFDNGRSEEGVDADELWAAISPMLPEEPQISPSRNNRRLFLLLLLFFALLGTSGYYYFSVSTQSTSVNHPIAAQAITDQRPTTDIDNSTPLVPSQATIFPSSTENLLQETTPIDVEEIHQTQQYFYTPPPTTIVANNASTESTNASEPLKANPQNSNINKQISPTPSTPLANTKTTALVAETTTLPSLDLPFPVQSQHTNKIGRAHV